MNIVWSWLTELVELPTPLTAGEGAAKLTSVGLEVEQVTQLGTGFEGAVIAEVLAVRPHPDADKLRIVTVRGDKGGDGIDVVCGAPNVPPPGNFVVWAKPGARVGDMVMAPKTLKGVVSPGMLCGETELGIGDDPSGIIVLAPGSGVHAGQDAKAALGASDWVLDVNVPANRADCLGHVGVARELAAVCGGSVKLPPLFIDGQAGQGATPTAVQIADGADCNVYSARLVTGVASIPSPRLIQHRLRAIGVRPKNLLVDVTNYVMFESGQPLHAFDADALAGRPLGVRRSRAGEKIKTLDGAEHALDNDLLIVAGDEPVALAGVMGGANSEVGDKTTSIVLEAAHFLPKSVRTTRTRLNVPSEASQRFERGVDAANVLHASARAAYLLQTHGGAKVCAPSALQPVAWQAAPVSLSLAKLARLTGVTYDPQDVLALLRRLGFAAEQQGDVVVAQAASWRPDVTRDVDLIEEILRHGGLDRVPTTLPKLSAAPTGSRVDVASAVRDVMVAAGLCEAITYGFLSEQRLRWLGDETLVARAMPLKNQMTQDQALMRTHLLPNLLAALARNEAHQVNDVALFEVGSVFWRAEGNATGVVTTLGREPLHVAAVVSGRRQVRMKDAPTWDYFDLKAVVERLAALFEVTPIFTPVRDVAYLHPGASATVSIAIDGATRVWGLLGELHPDARGRADIDGAAFVLHLDLSGLLLKPVAQFRPIPRFPATSRDMSLLVAESLAAADMRAVLAAAATDLVEGIDLLEEYRDAKLPSGTKSMLWSVTYRAADRTLTEKDVEAAHESMLVAAKAQLGATAR
ncbi:MAG: phenylalanine--tRNA ligase subunit beta [Myxococcales bacterium]|nr:phenylalanine--tRNA ligase subunit beta [Myxococcales bacterium]